MELTRLERWALSISPRWALRRIRSRLALDMLTRYYDAASSGRRTAGWRRGNGDGNQATDVGLGIRVHARDLVRNNPWAKRGVNSIVNKTIGWGIEPQLPPGRFAVRWKQWAETPACDADGRNDLQGLAKLIFRTVVVSGECLVRRRLRFVSDGLPLPVQLQVLEPDFLDDQKDESLPNGGEIIQGVEFSPIGKREAYWLLPEHPGAARVGVRGSVFRQSDRIPASEILHICKPDRPGQVRDVSWLAPIVRRLKDLDDYEDAALMKQKIAACLAVLISGDDPGNLGVGTDIEGRDSLQPGLMVRTGSATTTTVVDPPAVSEHGPYTTQVLRGIAAGAGIGYEDLTGDFQNMPFSAARMSRIQTWENIHDWRWSLMVPQFYDPVWAWAVDAADFVGAMPPKGYAVQWTPPPMPMLDPAAEGQAYIRNVRGGLQSLSDAHRELGYDPKRLLEELAADLKELDRLGLLLDSDPRVMTQAGQLQGKAAPKPEPAVAPAPEDDSDPEDDSRAARARRTRGRR